MKIIGSLSVFLLASTPAWSQLVLNVDSTTEEYFFTGSDTGTAQDIGGADYAIEWGFGNSTSFSFQDIDTGFGISGSSFDYADFSYTTNTTDYIGVIMRLNSLASTTLTGNGTRFDYSGFSAVAKSNLETQSSMALDLGSGFSAINIVQVPETSAYAALLGLSALTFAIARRRRS